MDFFHLKKYNCLCIKMIWSCEVTLFQDAIDFLMSRENGFKVNDNSQILTYINPG